MAYDFEKMKADGYDDSQISEAIGFDYTKMKADGYDDSQISEAIDSRISDKDTSMVVEQEDAPSANTQQQIKDGFKELSQEQVPTNDYENKQITLVKQLQDNNKVDSYDKINTMGMEYPERSFTDVLTGRMGTPQEVQNKIIADYLDKITKDGALTDVSDILLNIIPPVAGAKVAKNIAGIIADSSNKITVAERTMGEAIAGRIGGESTNIAKKMGISIDEARRISKGSTDATRANVLAEQGGLLTQGIRTGGIQTDAITKVKQIEIFDARKRAMEETIGKSSVADVSDIASDYFKNVVKLSEEFPLASSFDGTVLKDITSKISPISVNSKTAELLDNISKLTSDTPLTSVDQIIELRKKLNYEANKANSSSARIFKEAKDKVDLFLKENADPELVAAMDKGNELYTHARSMEDALEALKSSSSTVGTGANIGERGAVNWSELNDKLKDIYTNTPQMKKVVELTKEFTKKFGDMDTRLFHVAEPSAVYSGTSNIIATSPTGHIARQATVGIFEFFSKYIYFTEKASSLRQEKAISNAIKNTDTNAEFMMYLSKNPNTPEMLAKDAQDSLDSLNITSKNLPIEKRLANSKLKEAQDLQIQRNSADLAIDKQNDKLSKLYERKSNLEQSNNPNQYTLDRIEYEIEIASKELDLKIQNHARISDKYDATQVKLEEMSDFLSPKQQASRPQVSNMDNVTKPKEQTSTAPKPKEAPKANTKKYSLPNDLIDNPYIEEALRNGDVLVKKKVGSNIRLNQRGSGTNAQGDTINTLQNDVPSNALQTHLSRASVNRIKAGKGTEKDFESLRLDAEELDRLYFEMERDSAF